MPPTSHLQPDGYLLANLVHFGRMLRRAGIQVNSAQIGDLARGLTFIDLSREADFFHATRGFLVHDSEKFGVYKQIFDLYWSGKIELLMNLGASQKSSMEEDTLDNLPESDQVTLRKGASPRHNSIEDAQENGRETSLNATYSPDEVLRRKDFAEFDAEELEMAKTIVTNLVCQLDQRLTRRKVRATKRASSLDLRRTMRLSMKQGGEITRLAWRRRKPKPRPLVVISDISASMERYSRLFLHFMYTLVQNNRRVEAYVFGTRLTCITPALRQRQVDVVVEKMADLVFDWSGGTRIGEALKTFNFKYLRRSTGRGAVVIIISDGWDRGDIDLLEGEVARLRRSAARLIWLNPLAGDPDYQPLVRGMQAVLPYVDDFLPLHNLESMATVAAVLGSLRIYQNRAFKRNSL
jgi:uncharacterized protein